MGLFTKSIIKSIGKADNPKPPNNINKIHPKNDNNAIAYTGKPTSNSTVVSFSVYPAPGLVTAVDESDNAAPF